jgi:deazaflavin-dependent oxidoreductase (nitroreductase family)
MTFPTNDHNREMIEKFRANNGKMPDDAPLLLLTTTGAKTGKTRINPLVYTRDSQRYVVLASKGGAPTNPDWYHNLVANPDVVVEVGPEKFQARAMVAEGAERERLFNAQASKMPNFGEYQTKTSRLIPVVVLEPLASG